jgi:hypothetical protein
LSFYLLLASHPGANFTGNFGVKKLRQAPGTFPLKVRNKPQIPSGVLKDQQKSPQPLYKSGKYSCFFPVPT